MKMIGIENSRIDDYVREAVEYFEDIPAEDDREYEKRISGFAERSVSAERKEALKRIIADHLKCDYEAFYCLCTVYRRSKDFELMSNLLRTHPEFNEHPSFNHLLVQYYVHSETFFDYEELLQLAYNDAEKYDSNAGYLQAFCNAFVTIAEQCDEESRDRILSEWYSLAYDCINKAIDLDPEYAKFYSTKARIVGIKGNYAEAEGLIKTAISKENSNRPDYAIIIQNYQLSKMELAIRRLDEGYKRRISELEQEIESLKTGTHTGSESTAKSRDVKTVHAYTGKDPYCFISYAHRDSEEVYALIAGLQDENMNIWFDEGIRVGAEWPEEIGERLVGCEAVIVMLSSNSIQSANVRREVNMAMAEDKKVVVIILDDVTLSPGMKLQFGLYQMLSEDKYDRQTLISMIRSAVMGD